MAAFPISEASPIAHAAPLPAKVDVAVIGGGVIGVMTAWYLRRKGLSVLLCEKGRIAGEQSSRNWGWVRQQGRDAAELPIMMESRRIWQDLAAETGVDLGYRQTGILYISNTEKDLAEREAWMMNVARGHQLDTRMLSRAQVLEMMPAAEAASGKADWPGGLVGGMWTASDGRAEPWVAVPALARAAAEAGVTVIENCAVRALDMTAGRVAGLVTEKGRVAAEAVVLAGGAWSSLFLQGHGVKLPQLSVLASVAQTKPLPEVFAGGAVDADFAFRRREDGGYSLAPGDFHEFFIGPDAFRHLRAFWPEVKASWSSTKFRLAAPRGYPDGWSTPRRWSPGDMSPFEAIRVLNPRPSMAELERIRGLFSRAFPGLGPVEIASSWAGMIDTMPDVVPVVDAVPALPGLTLATGMSGHGFGIGPGMGRVIADIATGGAPGHDLSRFRFSRFADGSRLAGGPAL